VAAQLVAVVFLTYVDIWWYWSGGRKMMLMEIFYRTSGWIKIHWFVYFPISSFIHYYLNMVQCFCIHKLIKQIHHWIICCFILSYKKGTLSWVNLWFWRSA
jgi:hypothetical protein